MLPPGFRALTAATLAMVALAGCGSSDEDATSGGGAAAGTLAGGTGASGAAPAAGSGGAGGSGAGGHGGGPAPGPACAPFPPPNGDTIAVEPAQAAQLPDIVGAAAPGTTIVLSPGVYAIGASLQFLSGGVTLRSSTDSAADVTIDAGYAVNEAIVIAATEVTIAHVTVTRAVDHLIHIYPPGPDVNVTAPVLYGLALVDGGEQFVKVNPIGGQEGWIDDGRVECSTFRLTDEGRPQVESCCGGCYTGGIDAHSTWRWTVRNNRFEGIWCPSGLAEHAIHFWKGARDTLVENNVIVDCARGIGFGLGAGAGERVYPDAPYGGALLAHYDGIIRNNVVWADIPAFDTGIELDETRTPRALHNTVVHGAGATAFFSSIDVRFEGSEATLSNNLVASITERDGAVATQVTNVEDADLGWFVGAGALDFHLASGADAAIDQGTVDEEAGLDMDGEPHTLGGAPDVGADERAR